MKFRAIVIRRVPLVFCLAAGLLAAAPVQADDGSVKSRLDAVGQKYEVDKDGDYKITYTFTEEKRTQLVFVSGRFYEVADGIRVRNVFSAVANVQADDIAAKALDLLKLNNGYTIGAYEIEGNMLLFSIKIPDDATATQLLKATQLVASVADEREKALSGARDCF